MDNINALLSFGKKATSSELAYKMSLSIIISYRWFGLSFFLFLPHSVSYSYNFASAFGRTKAYHTPSSFQSATFL
jgi:hypothetical protein